MKCRKAWKVLYFYMLGFSAFVLRFFASLRMTGTRSVLFTGNFSKLPAPLKIQLMAACLQAIVRQCGATALLATTWPLGHQRSMLTFKNRKTLIINIHLTNQVDNACFLATRAAQTMSVLRATICCKHYRLIKLIPQHPAKQAKAMSGTIAGEQCLRRREL